MVKDKLYYSLHRDMTNEMHKRGRRAYRTSKIKESLTNLAIIICTSIAICAFLFLLMAVAPD